jgi:hypothetical protein
MCAQMMKSSGPEVPSITRRSHLIVPLGAIAVGATIIALTCLVVLVVVASTKKVEALPTVALSVAIVAFVVQVIVFIVQGAASNAQTVQSQELHGRLLELLAGIKEQTEGTQTAFSKQNERLLESLDKAWHERGAGGEGARVAAEVASRAQEASGDESSSGTRYLRRKPRPDDAERLTQLQTLPSDDELPVLLADVTALTKAEQIFLKGFGDDELRILERGDDSALDPGLVSPAGLDARGLVSEVPHSIEETGQPIYRLTDYGRRLARLLTGTGELVPTNREKLDQLRGEVEEADRMMKGLMA